MFKEIKEYLKNSKELIKYKDVIEILSDDELFYKFYNYDQNKESFNKKIEFYLNDIYNFIENKENLNISKNYMEKFDLLMQKYSLLIKREHDINGEKPFENINEDIKKIMLENISDSDSKFVIARKIYLNSCLFFNYDMDYLFYNSISNGEDVQNKINRLNSIKYKKLKEISLKNRNIICTTWAKIYARLLCEVGIKARIVGDYHKYVIFDCDGTLMMADATKSTKNSSIDIFSNDLVRVKLKLATKSYMCLENNKNITKILEQVDFKIGYPNINLDNLKSNFLNLYNTVDIFTPDINLKFKNNLAKLFSIMKSLNFKGIEKIKAIENYVKLLFPLEELANINYIFSIKDTIEKKEPYLIFTYKLYDKILYFLIGENIILNVSKEELQEKLSTEYYLLNASISAIPGFEKARVI